MCRYRYTKYTRADTNYYMVRVFARTRTPVRSYTRFAFRAYASLTALTGVYTYVYTSTKLALPWRDGKCEKTKVPPAR